MAAMRKIPDKILAKLDQIDTPAIVVGFGRTLTVAEMEEQPLQHLHISYVGGQLRLPEHPTVPQPIGPFSDENINGREVIHKDQPKYPKSVYMGERPNYGDWSKGSFGLWSTRKVYPRSFIPPRHIAVKINDNEHLRQAEIRILSFRLEPHLVRADAHFEDTLLFYLNLCKEVLGGCDVFKSDVSPRDIISSRKLQWEIFPPGERSFRTELQRRLANASSEVRQRLLARADVIESLNPSKYAIGTGFNSNYYGAIFADDLVVFENLEYGNATYILRDDWERLSQLSRTELLATDADFDRLLHNDSWATILRRIIRDELRKRRR